MVGLPAAALSREVRRNPSGSVWCSQGNVLRWGRMTLAPYPNISDKVGFKLPLAGAVQRAGSLGRCEWSQRRLPSFLPVCRPRVALLRPVRRRPRRAIIRRSPPHSRRTAPETPLRYLSSFRIYRRRSAAAYRRLGECCGMSGGRPTIRGNNSRSGWLPLTLVHVGDRPP